jgi:hypothetical protein
MANAIVSSFFIESPSKREVSFFTALNFRAKTQVEIMVAVLYARVAENKKRSFRPLLVLNF